MAEIIRIKKGLDIPLKGALTEMERENPDCRLYAVIPDDYPGFKWRLLISASDTVNIGTPLLTDKSGSGINVVSPVGGRVKDVVRGERRKIERIVIETDATQEGETKISVDLTSDEAIRKALAANGLWVMLRQRPYDIVPAADAEFRDIFVTAFDSAPLAPEIIFPTDYADFEKGLKILSRLTSGKVFVGTRFGAGFSSNTAEVTEYQGPHPAGNVGTQIAAKSPVNKGETVLVLDARTAVRIGRLSDGVLDMKCNVAVTGPEVETPMNVKTIIGAEIKTLIKDNLKTPENDVRIISGNVLTGYRVYTGNGFLRYPWRQITVISEGEKADEFMGWASMNPMKYSVKRTFPAFLRGLSKPFNFDARVLGGHRSMILSGEYDKVFPFDIYPEYLIKAIEAKDIDRMEKLGIYEVAPEDFALAEFVDTSKLPLQQIVADGLNYLRSETE